MEMALLKQWAQNLGKVIRIFKLFTYEGVFDYINHSFKPNFERGLPYMNARILFLEVAMLFIFKDRAFLQHI